MCICSKDAERKRNSDIYQEPLLCCKCAKIMSNNRKLDLININAYTKFGNFYQFILKISRGNEIMMDGMMDGRNDGQSKDEGKDL